MTARALAAALVATTMIGSASAKNLPEIFAELGPSVARVEFVGELYNGERETGTGSGFLVSEDGLILTCRHVLPDPANYRSFEIYVRFGGRDQPAVKARAIWSASSADIALLEVIDPAGAPLRLDAAAPLPGTSVAALGFPINLDLNITSGIVSGRDPPHHYVMDTTINPGNSGGPIITMTGRVIGVAWGAHLVWKNGNQTTPLQGIRLFTPISAFISELPQPYRERINASAAPPFESAVLPEQLRRSFTIDVVKDDHPVVFAPDQRSYALNFDAEPGYRIVDTNLTRISDTRLSGLAVEVSPSGDRATVRFNLTSGPLTDQWRGWFESTLELTQVRAR
jgi:hypothetical protein